MDEGSRVLLPLLMGLFWPLLLVLVLQLSVLVVVVVVVVVVAAPRLRLEVLASAVRVAVVVVRIFVIIIVLNLMVGVGGGDVVAGTSSAMHHATNLVLRYYLSKTKRQAFQSFNVAPRQ